MIALEPSQSATPRNLLLAKLAVLACAYVGRPGYTQSRNGDLRENGWLCAAKWRGQQSDGAFLITFGCEYDALDFRSEAVRLIAESGLDAETELRGTDVIVRIEDENNEGGER